MSNNGNAWNAWAMDRILWWCCESGDIQGPIRCSRALQSLFSHPVKTLRDLTGDYDTAMIEMKVQTLLASPEEDVRFVCSFDLKDGKGSFQHSLRLRHHDGGVTVFAECIDVTEMVMLEGEIVEAQGRLSLAQIYERQTLLEEQNRLIQDAYQKQSRFLALLSHELRSPLLGINSMVDRLKQRYAHDAFLSERLRVINLTSEQMTFLVNDILTYSQTEYDVITLHPRRFSLNQVFEYVKQLTKSIAADKGVFVSLVYFGDRDWVYGDSVRLSQILINLIVNGIKFTRFGGVSVEVSQGEGDEFEFMVMDSGEGIAADKLAHIFDPFVQFETEGSTQTLGSGLGLSVVKRLIDVMEGEIRVTSTPGVGSTFYFSLRLPASSPGDMDEQNMATRPLPQRSGQAAQTALKSGAEESIEQKDQSSAYRILVVDDSKINRMVLCGFLKELDGRVSEAHDGEEAWEKIQREPFDFIFLDIQMPKMDGFEVMRRINRLRDAGRLPDLKGVFAVTAGGGEELIPEGETRASLGFARWLIKPITQSQVADLLSEAELSDDEGEPESEGEGVQGAHDAQLKTDLENVPEAFIGMMEAFSEEMAHNVGKLRNLIEAGQWHEVKALAHYMKGNCMVFQLNHWVELMRAIEVASQEAASDEQKRIQLRVNVNSLETGLKHLENFQVIGHNSAN